MSSIKQFSHDLKEYINSDLMKHDYETASQGDTTLWMDIGLRVGLCFGCVTMSMNKLELFGVMFTLENGKIKPEEEITYSGVLQNWKNVIEQIQTIMGTEEYKKLVEKGRGRIKFDRFVKDGCATEYIDLDYNKSLIDHLLKSCVYSCDTLEDKIKAINNISVFMTIRKSNVSARVDTCLKRVVKDSEYTHKFSYELGAKLIALGVAEETMKSLDENKELDKILKRIEYMLVKERKNQLEKELKDL